MSEQKERFTVELDRWTQAEVIEPVWSLARDYFSTPNEIETDDVELHFDEVKKAIRERVFDSYRAGCRATEDKLG